MNKYESSLTHQMKALRVKLLRSIVDLNLYRIVGYPDTMEGTLPARNLVMTLLRGCG
jgi:hypothetical protein